MAGKKRFCGGLWRLSSNGFVAELYINHFTYLFFYRLKPILFRSFLSWVAEEIINPDRNIPLSLFVGISVVCTVYMLFNFAIFCGPVIAHEISKSPFILVSVSDLFISVSDVSNLETSDNQITVSDF